MTAAEPSLSVFGVLTFYSEVLLAQDGLGVLWGKYLRTGRM